MYFAIKKCSSKNILGYAIGLGFRARVASPMFFGRRINKFSLSQNLLFWLISSNQSVLEMPKMFLYEHFVRGKIQLSQPT